MKFLYFFIFLIFSCSSTEKKPHDIVAKKKKVNLNKYKVDDILVKHSLIKKKKQEEYCCFKK